LYATFEITIKLISTVFFSSFCSTNHKGGGKRAGKKNTATHIRLVQPRKCSVWKGFVSRWLSQQSFEMLGGGIVVEMTRCVSESQPKKIGKIQ